MRNRLPGPAVVDVVRRATVPSFITLENIEAPLETEDIAATARPPASHGRIRRLGRWLMEPFEDPAVQAALRARRDLW